VARWFRWDLSVADPFVCRCLTIPTMLPFPHPAHRTGRADLPHPALGEDSRNRRSHLHVTPSATSGNNLGVVRLIANLPFRRRFVCPPSTETPFLHRNYPASSVLRASPPSPSARPVSRELPVDLYRDHRWDFPCCVWSTLPACRRQYPGRSDGTCSLVRFHSLRPSPKSGRVGSCVSLFEACSAFTHVTACMLTESPMRPSTPKASAASLPPPLLRLLPGGANQFPGGFTSRYGPPPFTAHPISRLTIQVEFDHRTMVARLRWTRGCD